MITKSQIQFIRSLDQKKCRDESACFAVEGSKLVREALDMPDGGRFAVKTICATAGWVAEQSRFFEHTQAETIIVTEKELERISLQKSPNQALAIISRNDQPDCCVNPQAHLLIGLSQVQDPGNVGTIIRLADWFGLGGVIASGDSADFFAPKVVQSSMGSIFRVPLQTADLRTLIQSFPAGYPVYGTHLHGTNLYTTELSDHGLILLGNESKGLPPDLMRLTTKSLLIPNYATGPSKPESLNVSIAAAVVCSEFRRRGNG